LQPVFCFFFIVVVAVHDRDPDSSADTFHGLPAGYSGLLRRVLEGIILAWWEILAIRMYRLTVIWFIGIILNKVGLTSLIGHVQLLVQRLKHSYPASSYSYVIKRNGILP